MWIRINTLLQQPCQKNMDRNQEFNPGDMCQEESGQIKKRKKIYKPTKKPCLYSFIDNTTTLLEKQGQKQVFNPGDTCREKSEQLKKIEKEQTRCCVYHVLPRNTWFINLLKSPVCATLLLLQQLCQKSKDRKQGLNPRDTCQGESEQLKKQKRTNQVLRVSGAAWCCHATPGF